MDKKQFSEYLKSQDFQTLFISELGWNKYKGNAALPTITASDTDFNFVTVAERNGVQILSCAVTDIPRNTVCKQIDTKLRRLANDYICIYYLENKFYQQWVATVKADGKRDLVSLEYTSRDQLDFLYSKINSITFELDEHTLYSDVRERIQSAFAVNSEKVTKDFYAGFKTEHKAFAEFITGIDDNLQLNENKNKQWYASVMLNRLMFCYFIQKKGFLDLDYDYLQHKLAWCKAQRDSGQTFYSFYKQFLCILFHDGLNAPSHNNDFENIYGRIPYLNGGMFDEHEIEKLYKNIDIKDEAFERLFNFFDKWRWHLDTRITASGKDINPDVLGYIFEQYINDRAQMGAYYTKEDITEYIGKNCIIPFLFDSVRKSMEGKSTLFTVDGYVWTLLKQSGDKYLYDAVKRGYTPDWQTRIPDYIADGLDTTDGTNLLERRAHWNEKTYDEFALPTEIWRETIERFKRCDEVLELITSGNIREINDFITYNLDIRQFFYDLIAQTDDRELVLCVLKALKQITILDPTCGSGAFLFAAMNILEPLYEICIIRIQEFNESDGSYGNILDEIKSNYKSNIQYFIYKSIILNNLYGVDIMVEATEVAKLRLFLKMVAVVEVNPRESNLGLDPLPDVDFNIKCGNTLVGYTSEQEVLESVAYENLFAKVELEEKIKRSLESISKSNADFKRLQITDGRNIELIKEAKADIKNKLAELNLLLNKSMFGTGTLFNAQKLKDTQPFHWIAEFYSIMQDNGGFDVIIGNPPYVEFPSPNVNYSFDKLETKLCGNLYGCCIERALNLGNDYGKFSFIIPVAISCSKRMDPVIKILKKKAENIWLSNYDDRPGKLFEMIEHLRASILIVSKSNVDHFCCYSTKYNRWNTEQRNLLFNTIRYVNVTKYFNSFVIPKMSTKLECNINDSINNSNICISSTYSSTNYNNVYYRAAGGGYFLLIKNARSRTKIDGVDEKVKAEKEIGIDVTYQFNSVAAILSSSLFYWYYISLTDCRNLTKSFIDTYKIPSAALADINLSLCGLKLFADYEKNKYTKNTLYRSGHNVIYDEYYPKKSKNLIDEIDKVLAKHYGFTDEELDFIINYDIKYRMGDELAEDNVD